MFDREDDFAKAELRKKIIACIGIRIPTASYSCPRIGLTNRPVRPIS